MGDAATSLEYLPIDLPRCAELCVSLRREANSAALPDDPEFFERMAGVDGTRYLAWLAGRVQAFPTLNVHVLHEGEIIGQLEAGSRPGETYGYVNLFYLIPSQRSRGLGRALGDYALAELRRLGYREARLTSSASNEISERFYRGTGWQLVGKVTGDARLNVWRYPLVPEEQIGDAGSAQPIAPAS